MIHDVCVRICNFATCWSPSGLEIKFHGDSVSNIPNGDFISSVHSYNGDLI